MTRGVSLCKIAVLSAIGGAALALAVTKGHYAVRYFYLNAGLPRCKRGPLWAPLPPIRTVDWERGAAPKKILVVQSSTENIGSFARLSAEINGAYARLHGYAFVHHETELPAARPRNPCWDKVVHLRSHLKEGDSDAEYIFWIDSDAAIDRTDRRLESIAASSGGADLSICVSMPLTKNVNTGAMLLRATPWMRRFADDWWGWDNARWHKGMCHEQSALDEMLLHDHLGCRTGGHVALFGWLEFNSGYDRPGKFVQHHRCRPAQFRTERFEEMSKSRLRRQNPTVGLMSGSNMM
jgi:hypothetical protein